MGTVEKLVSAGTVVGSNGSMGTVVVSMGAAVTTGVVVASVGVIAGFSEGKAGLGLSFMSFA